MGIQFSINAVHQGLRVLEGTGLAPFTSTAQEISRIPESTLRATLQKLLGDECESGFLGTERLFSGVPYLPPHQNSVQIPGYKGAVLNALKRGTFNKLLALDEPLEVAHVMPVGDLHAYLTVYHIEWTAKATVVTLSYLVRGPEGNSREEFLSLEIPGDSRDNPRQLYQRLDAQICNFLRSFQSHPSSLINQTRRIRLTGQHSDKIYEVYYKPGRSAFMETIGTEALRAFHLAVPRTQFDPDNHCTWVQGIPATTLYEFMLNYCDKGSRRHTQVLDLEITPTMQEAFFNLGRASVIHFILGGEDLHSGNILWTVEGQPWFIDHETIGGAIHYGLESTPTTNTCQDPVLWTILCQFNAQLSALFSLTNTNFFNIPLDLAHRLIVGIEFALQEISDTEKNLARLLPSHLPNHLYARTLLAGTGYYIQRYGNHFPVPHYSFHLSPDQLKIYFRDRIEKLQHFSSRGYRFKPRLGFLFQLEV